MCLFVSPFQALDDERRSSYQLHLEVQRLTVQSNEYQNLAEQFDFKKQNYDRIKL